MKSNENMRNTKRNVSLCNKGYKDVNNWKLADTALGKSCCYANAVNSEKSSFSSVPCIKMYEKILSVVILHNSS